MTRWSEDDLANHLRAKGQAAFAEAERAAKPSKYRNVKIVVDGITFDSKREAQYWQTLKLREKIGEITDLKRQVSFDLLCPIPGSDFGAVVAHYLADYTFTDTIDRSYHVVDAKGKRTRMFDLKAKWLELQSGIVIETV